MITRFLPICIAGFILVEAPTNACSVPGVEYEVADSLNLNTTQHRESTPKTEHVLSQMVSSGGIAADRRAKTLVDYVEIDAKPGDIINVTSVLYSLKVHSYGVAGADRWSPG
jgi:hypothetical protein